MIIGIVIALYIESCSTELYLFIVRKFLKFELNMKNVTPRLNFVLL